MLAIAIILLFGLVCGYVYARHAKAIEARSAKTTEIGLARRAKARSASADLPNPEGSIHEGQ